MKLIRLSLIFSLFISLNLGASNFNVSSNVSPSKRVAFAMKTMSGKLSQLGHTSSTKTKTTINYVVVDLNHPQTKKYLQKKRVELKETPKKEGYLIQTIDNTTYIIGADGNGAIYGCLEVAEKTQASGSLYQPEYQIDAPEMVLRGTAIGLQKPTYLPGRHVYEYPYTPENFPWFYDKQHWIEYLDMLVENRMNSVYLWNGHPFASLVQLKDYPYAVEVDEETFRKNEAMFRFITEEADRRGVYVIQMFYNIILPKPLAEKHGIATQDRNRPITPLASDYTRKSIAAFIEKYPNVGLLVCLGEAMDTYDDDVEWFTKTVIPGVKDGLKTLGITNEPPLLLRAHDTDARRVVDAALPLYKNLYTMHKYNGESLTTYQPRGPWGEIHKSLSSLGSVHISNVHILANQEPWRYGSPDFIQKTVQAMHDVHGANALHLYPQSSFWDWPYTADKLPGGNRLKQLDRDFMWYKAWSRYAWNCRRDRKEEIRFWDEFLGEYYGTENAGGILTAYEETGEIAPKLLRRFGITEGNRQTLLLGMFVSQLVNPYKYKIYPGFYESCGPEGEKLIERSEKEWKKIPHQGELPLDIVEQTIVHADKAVEAINQTSVSQNKAEFLRLKNDVYCYREFAYFFNYKVKAAKLVLDYQYGKDLESLEKVIPLLEKSLSHWRKLVAFTRDNYLYANSMQTAQRRIPIGGDHGKNKTWEEMLVHYEKELTNFKVNLNLLKNKENGPTNLKRIEQVVPAKIELKLDLTQRLLKVGDRIYAGRESEIEAYAPELNQLKMLVLDDEIQMKEGTQVNFESKDTVYLWVGYFRDDQTKYAKAPTLETDAAANNRGQADPVLLNAIRIKGLPMVNIHSYEFAPGNHSIQLPKGMCIVTGFTTQKPASRDAQLAGTGTEEAMDWLFY